MYRKLLSFAITTTIVGLAFTPLIASAASFYEGKTIRIIVGVSAGGGYDAYARARVTQAAPAGSLDSYRSRLAAELDDFE